MGGCASKPKDLDNETVPAPTPVKASVAPEAETVAQEAKNGGEKKEEPLIDLSEPAPEAPKAEETTTNKEKPAIIEAIMAEAVEEAKEVPKEEEKEVVATA